MSQNSPKNFSCIRVAAIRHWDFGKFGATNMPGKKTGLAGYLAHDFRFMATPNAAKELTGTNLVFSKKTKWKALKTTHENLRKIGIKNPFNIPKRAEKTLRRLKVQVQKNSIIATALMLTVSPEVLRNGDKSNEVNKEILDQYIKGTLEFLRNKFGNRLLLACLHMDELNPHISAYVLPLIKKEMKKSGRSKKGEKGKKRETRLEVRLGHTEMFTRDKLIYEITPGTEIEVIKEIFPGTCSILQDEYADALKEMGLDVIRGVRPEPGMRRLKYVTAKRQYERMMRGVKKADEAIARFKQMKPEEQEEIIRQWIALATESNGYRIQRDHYQVLAAKKDEKIEKLEKQIADSMRDLPVEKAIQAITGAEPIPAKIGDSGEHSEEQPNEPDDTRLEFRLSNQQVIAVDTERNRFENLTPEIPFQGEGAKRISAVGAINAVMYLTGCSYDSAIGRLAVHFGDEAAKLAAARKVEADTEPAKQRIFEPDDSQWDNLFAKLKALNISEPAIKIAKYNEDIASNADQKLIVSKMCWDENGVERRTGSIIIDPMFPEAEGLEIGEDGLFAMADEQATRTIICANPLDALAIRSNEAFHDANVIAISGNPDKNVKISLDFFLKFYPEKVFFTENLLATGRRITDWIATNFGDMIKILPLPKGCRDWLGDQMGKAPTEPTNLDRFL